ncbi:hypothetical protein ACFXPA_27100 [Amycolatopsis sp. NPDC059090]|uniref:hypothetical protein n=1 Tax=unclassified Amycolatopsis TaxID=2618356 RepID=UPI00366FFF9F
MKHVRVEATGTGNYLDPRAYLGLLPGLSAELPPGARAFAADPDHYNFHGARCVKDLVLDTMQRGTADGED